MARHSILVPPSAQVWPSIARALLTQYPHDVTAARIIVPVASHIEALKTALWEEAGEQLPVARICTLGSWLLSQEPDGDIEVPVSELKRLLTLYAELRQHAWLKTLFTAKNNADLFPLAQTLLSLCNELSEAMLPAITTTPEAAEHRWATALEQLPMPVRDMLSEESKLVWTIWQSQLGNDDFQSVKFANLMRLAKKAPENLIWISSAPCSIIEDAFLNAYSDNRPVTQIGLNWSPSALPAVYAKTWEEVLDKDGTTCDGSIQAPENIHLISASSLEDEAQKGAQTVLQWLREGKTQLAIVAQDRIVSRRIRALLERANVMVTDETGWKLSTTRSAAAVISLFDVTANPSKAKPLFDLLKCPFIYTDLENKSDLVMGIESAVRGNNVRGGWTAIKATLSHGTQEYDLVEEVQAKIAALSGFKTIYGWTLATLEVLNGLSMVHNMEEDFAGKQVIELLHTIKDIFAASSQQFNLSEWRTLLGMQLEAAPFIAPSTDTRVVMLPLNGARLRCFQGVLVVGVDGTHLPSQISETMFFANAVRRELGLSTREGLQRQQMRDLTELALSGATIAMSRQTHRHGEAIPISPWIERLQLQLACNGCDLIPEQDTVLPSLQLAKIPPTRPEPSAPILVPSQLSPSGYNSFMSCPYQFFVTRMLRLSTMDDLSDTPEKRSYGMWLHEILNTFHVGLRDRVVSDRAALLADISEKVFRRELEYSPSALGFYTRWKKTMPIYLEWVADREAQGWTFTQGEQWMEKTLIWEDGAITLAGRVDRVDVNPEGEKSILDYKASGYQTLNDKLRDNEDHQLPFYGILSGVTPIEGEFVSLEMRDAKKAAASAKNYQQWVMTLEAQVVENVKALKKGATLPANGVGPSCEHCEVKGICRKKSWQEGASKD